MVNYSSVSAAALAAAQAKYDETTDSEQDLSNFYPCLFYGSISLGPNASGYYDLDVDSDQNTPTGTCASVSASGVVTIQAEGVYALTAYPAVTPHVDDATAGRRANLLSYLELNGNAEGPLYYFGQRDERVLTLANYLDKLAANFVNVCYLHEGDALKLAASYGNSTLTGSVVGSASLLVQRLR